MHNSLALIDETLVDSQGNPVFGGDLIVRDQEILFIVHFLRRSYVPNSRRVV